MTTPNMVDKRGRLFAMAAWVCGAGFSLIVFAMIMASIFPEQGETFVKLTSQFATIASVALGVLGARATADSWKKPGATDGAA